MIRLIEGEAFPSSLKSDPFGCRFWAAWNAYRGYGALCSSAFRLWEQEGSGLYLGLVDDALLLFPSGKTASGQEEWEEIVSFLPMTGAGKVLCPAFCGKRLGLPEEFRGRILRREGTAAGKAKGAFPGGEEGAPDLRAVYRLLSFCRSENFHPPAFEPFYLDLSHRIRHRAAFLSTVYREGEPAAAAIAPAVTEEAALLSGVAVHPGFRRRGLGTEAVNKLVEELAVGSFWVFRAEGENKGFYTSLGFREEGDFLQLSLS